MKSYDMSVIIPTFNRSELLERLLESLVLAAKEYRYGNTEVIVIDSSAGEERRKIQSACEAYGARFIEGTDSVREKRNTGILAASYPYILFEDSDVVVDRDLFNAHAKTYMEEEGNDRLGGSFGLTVFTGEDNFVWRAVQYTTLTDSFSFAEKWPYQDWTIGNNVSFKKAILEEVHLFEEGFPFKLGADDLDLSYRITHKGYQIKSQPEAVAYHAKDTWKKWRYVRERARRWGRMEYYISKRHPQIFINRVPKTEFVALFFFLLFGLFSLVSGSLAPLGSFALWLALTAAGTYLLDGKGTGKKNPAYYWTAKILDINYYFGHVYEALRQKSLNGLYKQMSFSPGQTRMILTAESKRLRMLLVNLLVAAFVMLLFW